MEFRVDIRVFSRLCLAFRAAYTFVAFSRFGAGTGIDICAIIPELLAELLRTELIAWPCSWSKICTTFPRIEAKTMATPWLEHGTFR